MRSTVCLMMGVVAFGAESKAMQAQATQIRHVVVSVPATKGEWTTTGLSVGLRDVLLVTAPGTIKVGQTAGEVDATGSRVGSRSTTGYGILEFMVGVGAARPSGNLSILRPETDGELRFRVRDTKYDDNSGAFEVSVVVIPEAAIPIARRVGGAGPVIPAASVAAERAMIISFLISLLTAEETFFNDYGRYTDKLSLLATVTTPAGVNLKPIIVGTGGNSWAAIATSSRHDGVECAIAVGFANPIDPLADEGKAICK